MAFYTSNAQNIFTEPVSFKLKNGMNIIVSENKKSEKAYANFSLDLNAFKDKKDGVSELLNAMLNEAAQQSGIQFRDNSGNMAIANNDFNEKLMEMAGLIQNTDLTQDLFNHAKIKLMASLKNQDYDYDQTVNENSVMALSLNDVKDFYSQINPANTFLTLAGNISTSDAKNSAKKAFANWKPQTREDLVIAHSK